MKPITILFEKLLPHLMVASAAVGVFMLMAVAIFFSILLENWYEKRHHEQTLVSSEHKLKMSWSKRGTENAHTFGRLRSSWQPTHASTK